MQSVTIQNLNDLHPTMMKVLRDTAGDLRVESERLGFVKESPNHPRLSRENFQRVKDLKKRCSFFLHNNQEIPDWLKGKTFSEVKRIFQMDAQHLKWIESTYTDFYSRRAN